MACNDIKEIEIIIESLKNNKSLISFKLIYYNENNNEKLVLIEEILNSNTVNIEKIKKERVKEKAYFAILLQSNSEFLELFDTFEGYEYY